MMDGVLENFLKIFALDLRQLSHATVKLWLAPLVLCAQLHEAS